MSLAWTFKNFVAEQQGKNVQICLKGGQPMMGQITVVDSDDASDPGDRVYQIVCEAQLGPGTMPVRMPFLFDGQALLWASSGPIRDEGAKIVRPPGVFDS